MKSALFILVIAIVSLTNVIGQTKTELANASDFKEQVSNTNTILVDIRTPQEFNASRMENAINIDFYSPSFISQMDQLPKDKTIMIYCRSGNRTGQATRRLSVLGFTKIVDLKHGLIGWQQINGELVQ